MQQAMEYVDGPIDYINTHGTSTPVGDVKELEALKTVFGDKMPYITATKSLSGHALGAAGVHEAIYSLLMMQAGEIAASANIEDLDEVAQGLPILRENLKTNIKTIMSNSFGFGGTNATLVFQALD
jgi:3-oxoacyl-[acyl-carrier-protein] synthase-1